MGLQSHSTRPWQIRKGIMRNDQEFDIIRAREMLSTGAIEARSDDHGETLPPFAAGLVSFSVDLI